MFFQISMSQRPSSETHTPCPTIDSSRLIRVVTQYYDTPVFSHPTDQKRCSHWFEAMVPLHIRSVRHHMHPTTQSSLPHLAAIIARPRGSCALLQHDTSLYYSMIAHVAAVMGEVTAINSSKCRSQHYAWSSHLRAPHCRHIRIMQISVARSVLPRVEYSALI